MMTTKNTVCGLAAILSVLVLALIVVSGAIGYSEARAQDGNDDMYRVIAMDNRGRAIYVDESGDLHGRLGRGFLGFGWKIIPEEKYLSGEEHATALEREAELAEKRLKAAKERAEKAAKAKAREEAESATAAIEGPPSPTGRFERMRIRVAQWFKRDT